jgi:hypothetical protein
MGGDRPSYPYYYIQALIQQDQTRKSQEALLLEGLESGTATPMTNEDWNLIRAPFGKTLAQVKAMPGRLGCKFSYPCSSKCKILILNFSV